MGAAMTPRLCSRPCPGDTWTRNDRRYYIVSVAREGRALKVVYGVWGLDGHLIMPLSRFCDLYRFERCAPRAKVLALVSP